MAAHTHSFHHGHFGNAWRLWLAEIGIVILACLGLYYGISEWLRGEIVQGLLVFGPLAGAAAVYAFGYLWCLPDVLGGTTHDQTRTLAQRWSDFALLSVFVALPIIVGAYVRTIWLTYSYINLAGALALLLACCWLLTTCVVASEQYLGWTMPRGEGRGSQGWRGRARHTVWVCGNWLVRLLAVKPSLVIGAALGLVSLSLPFGDGWFLSEVRGYSIAAGKDAWPLGGYLDANRDALLAQWCSTAYRLGLFVAILALAAVVPGRIGKMVRNSRVLVTLAGAVALLQVTDIVVTFNMDTYRPAFAIVIWAIAIAVWLWGSRSGPENWGRTRLAVMIFCLPIFLLGFAFSVFFTYIGPGIGAFALGMLLVWWGLVKRRHETEIQNIGTAG